MQAQHPGRLALLFAFSEEFHSPAEINTLRNVTVFLALNSSACRISLNRLRGLYARLVVLQITSRFGGLLPSCEPPLA